MVAASVPATAAAATIARNMPGATPVSASTLMAAPGGALLSVALQRTVVAGPRCGPPDPEGGGVDARAGHHPTL